MRRDGIIIFQNVFGEGDLVYVIREDYVKVLRLVIGMDTSLCYQEDISIKSIFLCVSKIHPKLNKGILGTPCACVMVVFL